MSQKTVWILGGGSIVAAAGVALVLTLGLRQDAPAPNATPGPVLTSDAPVAAQAQQATTPTAAPTATPTATPSGVPTPAPAALAPEPPTFDVVRIARDGAALVAGSAAPGAAVTLRVDGASAAEAVADSTGQFVAMFDLGASDGVQVMTLDMQGADGVAVAADATVILAPRPAEVAVVADAGPTADTDQADQPVQIASADMPATQTGPVQPVVSQPGVSQPGAPVLPVGTADPVAALPAQSDIPVPAQTADAAPQPILPAMPEVPAQPVTAMAQAPTTTPEPPQNSTVTAIPAPDSPLPAVRADADAVPAPAPAPAPVPVPDMPTAFLLRGDGAVQVLDRAPTVMDNVIIDSISYSSDGDVQIAGRAARAHPDANLRIYLDNRPIAVTQAERGDWASDLPAIDPGVYTLRVDQLGSEGGVVSRFETPFQREAPATVAAAQARANGATALSPAPVTEATTGPVASDGAADGAATGGVPAAPATPQSAAVVAAAPVSPVVTAAANTAAPAPRAALITVQPGNTLWAISQARYGVGERYVIIYHANRSQIRDPDLIYPGQIFALPDE